MKQRSVMKHQFSQVPKADIPRSSFDRSHGYKTAFNSGFLIPMFTDEALPGDTFNLSMTGFARLATPIFPVMDNMWMDTHFFAVPIRLIWDNWEKFNGAQDDPGDSTDFLMPTMIAPAGGWVTGQLADYFGIPTMVPQLEHSCLWHRAYNLIYNEWFRDQNLQNSAPVNTDDGPDPAGDYKVFRRGKRHDYFTSCLPWPQKSDNPVTLPLGDKAPLIGLGVSESDFNLVDANVRETQGTTVYPIALQIGDSEPLSFLRISGTQAIDGLPEMYADLTNATAATINALRQAFQVQKMFERDARSGTRYVETIKAHFGVTSPDFRLQRPEFLGGGTTSINITPVPNTVPTDLDPTTPQGTLAGFGTASLMGHGFTKSFTEHCILIGMVSVRADLTYQQGLNRMWSRQTRFDHYWPALSHLGEQAVLNKEIYAQGIDAPAIDEQVFGYQEIYAEYRYKPSLITGPFRSNDPQTLDAWHLSQNFVTLPLLNDVFIEEHPPFQRIIAVQGEPEILFDSYFQLKCARPMPLYGTPGLIDHF